MDTFYLPPKSDNSVCPICGEKIEFKTEITVVECSSCGYQEQPEEHLRRIKYARNIVHYGYHVRGAYEEDLEEGCLGEAEWSLPPIGEVLIFIGEKALAGIIAGASWKAIKVTCEHLRDKFRSGSEDRLSMFDKIILEDDDEFEKFLRHIVEMNGRMGSIDERILELLSSDVLGDDYYSVCHENTEDRKNNNRLNPTDRKSIAANMRNFLGEDGIDKNEMEKIWKRVDMSG